MNPLKALLTPSVPGALLNPNSQIKRSADPTKSIEFSGKKSTSLWGRCMDGLDRLLCESNQNINRAGIREYYDRLKDVNKGMADVALNHFYGRFTKGQAITLRAIRELAVDEFCTEEFINQNIIPTQEKLDACGDDAAAKDQLWEQATDSLELIKAHLVSCRPSENAKQRRKAEYALYFIDAKLEQSRQKIVDAPGLCTEILISNRYHQEYLQAKKLHQDTYPNIQECNLEQLSQCMASLNRLDAMAKRNSLHLSWKLGKEQEVLRDSNPCLWEETRRIFHKKSRSKIADIMESKTQDISEEELKKLGKLLNIAKKYGIQKTLKDGVWNDPKLDRHRRFIRRYDLVCDLRVQNYPFLTKEEVPRLSEYEMLEVK